MAPEQAMNSGERDGDDPALAAAVRAVLLDEEFVAMLVERVRERLGGAGATRSPAVLPTNPEGPEPIGPYEINPDFANMRWDSSRSAGDEWKQGGGARPGDTPVGRNVSGGPRVQRGDQIGSRAPGD